MKIQIKLKNQNVGGVSFAGTPEEGKNDMQRGHPPAYAPLQRAQQGAPLHRAQSKIFNFLISLSFFFLFFGTPLFFTNLTLQGMGFDKMLFFYFWLLVGVIAWVFKGIGEGEITFKRTPLDLPIVLFLIASFLSAVFSVDKWASFIGPFGIPQKSFLAIFAFAIFYWFLVSNITEKRLRMILRAILFSAGIIAVFMAVKFVSPLLWEEGSGVVFWGWFFLEKISFLFQPSFNTIGLLGDVSVFLFMGVLLISSKFKVQSSNQYQNQNLKSKNLIFNIWNSFELWILNFELKDLVSGFWFLVSLFLVYVVFSLFNYLNPYILLIPLSIIIIFSISKLINIGKFAKYFSIILFLAILGLSISVYKFKYNPKMTRVDLPAEAGISNLTSLDIAKSAVKENWFFGTGIGTFKYDFAKYRPKYLNNSVLWQAKFYETAGAFEMVATMGGFGSIIFVLLLLTYIGVGFVVLIGEKSNVGVPIVGTLEGSKNDMQRGHPPAYAPLQRAQQGAPLHLFISSLLLIIYCLFSLSSTTIILYAVMISSLFIAAMSLEGEAILLGRAPTRLRSASTGAARGAPTSDGNKKNDLFKEYVISYQTSPQYALAMAFVFVVFITGGVVLFALIGKTFMADAYAGRGNMGKVISLNGSVSEYYLKLGNENLKNALTCHPEERSDEGSHSATDSPCDQEKIRQLFISALNAHKAAVSLAPNDVEVWESFASVSEQIANYDPAILDDAIGAYQKSLELDPTNPLVDIHLGRLKLLKSDTFKDNKTQAQTLAGEAKVCYNKAVELKPDLKEAYEGLAMSEEHLGNLEQAINIYKKLFSVQPKSEAYPYKIAQLYEILSDKENADKYYKMTLENIGDRAGAEEVKGEIEKRMNE